MKKKQFKDGEIAIFDEACIYKRGEYWQFRMWLEKEKKYARKSLRTRSEATAIERGKDAYIEICGNLKQGKTYFSITTKEGVELFLEFQKKRVESGGIVKGRLITIKTHLEHWLNFIGRDTKLKELSITDCEEYAHFRLKSAYRNVKKVTIQNEQSTINACVKWLFRKDETYIDKFDFPSLGRIDKGNEATRRATLTNDEYMKLVRVAKQYSLESNRKTDRDELLVRKIMRYFVLIAANSGLRVGEQRQLKWSDVRIEEHKVRGEVTRLARIHVRKETSKVRTSRILLCRNGQYFERLRNVTEQKDDDALVFSVDGETQLTKRAMLYHFKKMLDLAEIEDWKERGVVLYSLRHFMITQRIMSGLDFRSIADMCGTSITQIENTYWHLNDAIRLTSAVADYKRRSDGTIEAI